MSVHTESCWNSAHARDVTGGCSGTFLSGAHCSSRTETQYFESISPRVQLNSYLFSFFNFEIIANVVWFLEKIIFLMLIWGYRLTQRGKMWNHELIIMAKLPKNFSNQLIISVLFSAQRLDCALQKTVGIGVCCEQMKIIWAVTR